MIRGRFFVSVLLGSTKLEGKGSGTFPGDNFGCNLIQRKTFRPDLIQRNSDGANEYRFRTRQLGLLLKLIINVLL